MATGDPATSRRPAPPFSPDKDGILCASSPSDGYLSTSDVNAGEDRISGLPDELLSNIVARLPLKDAARTAVLSPRWRRVWASTPLVLCDVDLFPVLTDGRFVPTTIIDAI